MINKIQSANEIINEIISEYNKIVQLKGYEIFKKYKSLFKTLGPGILFASTAIGVSHLVQSTRAGAEYGLIMLVFVLLATIFKYPFFLNLVQDMQILQELIYLMGIFKLNKWIFSRLFYNNLFKYVYHYCCCYICYCRFIDELITNFNKH